MQRDIVKITEQIFQPGGILESKGFPFRQGQYDMAMSVAIALRDNKIAICEAGTGTGKTLAYGVPLAIWSMEIGKNKRANLEKARTNREKPELSDLTPATGITVHTIALQEQLKFDSILIKELIFEATNERPIITRICGKGNYFCPDTARLVRGQESVPQEIKDLAGNLLREHGQRANDKTYTGMFEEMSASRNIQNGMLRTLSAESNMKTGKESPYSKAMQEARRSDVVILNHALVSFFPVDHLVVDEAHTLENVIASQHEYEVDTRKLQNYLSQLETHAPKECEDMGIVAKRAGQTLIAGWERYVQATTMSTRNRGTEILRAQNTQPIATHAEGQPLHEQWDAWQTALKNLITTVTDKHGYSELAGDDGVPQPAPGSKAMRYLKEIARLAKPLEQIVSWTQGEEPNDARWAELLTDSENGNSYHVVHRDLIELSEILAEFHSVSTVCLTSATLSGIKGLEDFQTEHGIPSEVAMLVKCASPFDLDTQMEVRIPANMPQPGKNEREYQQALPTAILECIKYTATLPYDKRPGGTLVIFTSIQSMEETFAALSSKVPALRKQERGVSKAELVQWMKNTPGATLFGVDSLATGIDLPGDAVKQVVIPRLPFDPGTPKQEKQRELAISRGLNGFMVADVAPALKKFRQALGRLIRGVTDTGTITILDNRIQSAGYGREFLKGIPAPINYNIPGITPKELPEPIYMGGL